MNAVMQAPATITSSRRTLRELLAQAGIESADVDARLLITHALGISWIALNH